MTCFFVRPKKPVSSSRPMLCHWPRVETRSRLASAPRVRLELAFPGHALTASSTRPHWHGSGRTLFGAQLAIGFRQIWTGPNLDLWPSYKVIRFMESAALGRRGRRRQCRPSCAGRRANARSLLQFPLWTPAACWCAASQSLREVICRTHLFGRFFFLEAEVTTRADSIVRFTPFHL